MTYRMLFVVACLLMPALSNAQSHEPPPNKALNDLFEREFNYQMKESPESATFTGIEDYNDRLADRSPAAIAARKAHMKTVARELQAFDPRQLNTQDRISRAIQLEDFALAEAYDTMYGALPFGGNRGWLIVGPSAGPLHLYPALAKATPFRDVRDYENYLKRLAALPRVLQQETVLMREGMRSGWLPPAEAMTTVPSQFDAFVAADVAGHPLFTPFLAFPPALADADRSRLEAAGRKLIADTVRPAFVELKRFIEQEYIPACRRSLAASSLPGGKAYYALTVREATTTELQPEAVHEIGLARSGAHPGRDGQADRKRRLQRQPRRIRAIDSGRQTFLLHPARRHAQGLPRHRQAGRRRAAAPVRRAAAPALRRARDGGL
jgi:uncharacterized protein (DUF885 family)